MKWNKYISDESMTVLNRVTEVLMGAFTEVSLAGQWQFWQIYFSSEAWNHPHFRASHWSRAQNWAFSLVKRPVYEKSKGVPFHFSVHQNCHWLANENFEAWRRGTDGDIYRSVIDQSMTVFRGLQKVGSWTFRQCHWPVNDSFRRAI